MKLIRYLGRRLGKTGISYQSWGLFWCSFCETEVEKYLGAGKKQKSCGDIKCKENEGNYKHGETKTRLHRIWTAMKRRCLNPNTKDYKDYGGRCITVYPEWLEFIPFRNWAIQNGYTEDLEIDRIDNDGNYEPSNCRWATHQENCKNRRFKKLSKEQRIKIIELHKTENYTQTKLAGMFGVSNVTISNIINCKRWKK